MKQISNLKTARSKTVSIFTVLTFVMFSFSSHAALTLDKSQSSINFISTKNQHISEQHSFDNFSGQISDNGELVITIDIASLNTNIPIRNERMQKMLFDMANFSTAKFTAMIPSDLSKLSAGEMKRTTVSGDMMIAGKTATVSFDIILTGLNNGSINATTVRSTILNASDFDLDEGIAALQKVAMLQSISKTVPLSFSATFAAPK
ncbi:YceI family protein [Glaciecola sp. MF2-115]|uniref:YceI family protein n=1 Tax=Glaciecola sp. MF2-115 TaxID=3384827 RepID=UPI0039A2AA1F